MKMNTNNKKTRKTMIKKTIIGLTGLTGIVLYIPQKIAPLPYMEDLDQDEDDIPDLTNPEGTFQ